MTNFLTALLASPLGKRLLAALIERELTLRVIPLLVTNQIGTEDELKPLVSDVAPKLAEYLAQLYHETQHA